MILAGKLESQPNLITTYMVYCPHKFSSDVYFLLQSQNTPAFSLGKLDFFYNQQFSGRGKNNHYTIKCEVELLSELFVYKVRN